MGRGSSVRGVLRVRDARALIGAGAASQLGDKLPDAALLGYAPGSAGAGADELKRVQA